MSLLFGLLSPFRRSARDFSGSSGSPLLQSQVRQVLLTEPGELPWRTAFGAGLGRLRHQNNDAVLQEIARVRVRTALQQWLPSATLKQVTASNGKERLMVRLRVVGRATSVPEDMELVA